jgi:hypothetical protein
MKDRDTISVSSLGSDEHPRLEGTPVHPLKRSAATIPVVRERYSHVHPDRPKVLVHPRHVQRRRILGGFIDRLK